MFKSRQASPHADHSHRWSQPFDRRGLKNPVPVLPAQVLPPLRMGIVYEAEDLKLGRHVGVDTGENVTGDERRGQS